MVRVRSRCTTSSEACFVSKQRRTTCPSSSTTARWNIARVRQHGDWLPSKKSIYSLIDLRDILFRCNRRYLEHLSALDDFSAGVRALDRLTKPRTVDDRTIKGINFFDPTDNALLHALQDPRVNIAGVRRADLAPLLEPMSPDRLSRQLRRLRDIGVIKRVAGTYRYYLTRIGRAATAALCRLTESILIPEMA